MKRTVIIASIIVILLVVIVGVVYLIMFERKATTALKTTIPQEIPVEFSGVPAPEVHPIDIKNVLKKGLASVGIANPALHEKAVKACIDSITEGLYPYPGYSYASVDVNPVTIDESGNVYTMHFALTGKSLTANGAVVPSTIAIDTYSFALKYDTKTGECDRAEYDNQIGHAEMVPQGVVDQGIAAMQLYDQLNEFISNKNVQRHVEWHRYSDDLVISVVDSIAHGSTYDQLMYDMSTLNNWVTNFSLKKDLQCVNAC